MYTLFDYSYTLLSGAPPREPPILEISAINTTEDNPVTIYLSAYSVDGSTETSNGLTIRITTFPSGSTFNRGHLSDEFWVLNHNNFGEIQLQLPEHSSGTYEITAEALYAGTSRTRVGTVQFMVQAIADAPSLDVTHSSCIESGSVSFMISSSLVDSDGSEMLLVTVTNLPTGSQLSAGSINGGDYILDPANLRGSITAIIPPSLLGNISIVFIATAIEVLNNSTASTNTTVSLSKCPEGIINALPMKA